MYRFLLLLIAFTAKTIFANRIYGGTNTSIEEIPYQVSIQVKVKNELSIVCGGSILFENVILTAAHCIDDDRNFFIRYGTSEHASGGTLLKVKHRVPHERFDLDGTNTNDIGLLFLNEPIKFSKMASRIELPKPTDTVPAGDMFTVTGWGSVGIFKPIPKYLQKVKVPMVDTKKCETFTELHPGMLCAGFIGSEGQGVCTGDSGGPLVWKGKQYGVVSFGLSICARGKPDIYANVAFYREWIDSTIKEYNQLL